MKRMSSSMKNYTAAKVRQWMRCCARSCPGPTNRARRHRAIAGRIPGSHYPSRIGRLFLQGNRRHRRRSHWHDHVASGPRPAPASADPFQNLHEMNIDHDRMQELLHAYVDGEIDLVSGQEVEEHLRSCEDCRRGEQQIRALRDAMSSDAPAYRAPAHLRRNVRAALRREAKESG